MLSGNSSGERPSAADYLSICRHNQTNKDPAAVVRGDTGQGKQSMSDETESMVGEYQEEFTRAPLLTHPFPQVVLSKLSKRLVKGSDFKTHEPTETMRMVWEWTTTQEELRAAYQDKMTGVTTQVLPVISCMTPTKYGPPQSSHTKMMNAIFGRSLSGPEIMGMDYLKMVGVIRGNLQITPYVKQNGQPGQKVTGFIPFATWPAFEPRIFAVGAPVAANTAPVPPADAQGTPPPPTGIGGGYAAISAAQQVVAPTPPAPNAF